MKVLLEVLSPARLRIWSRIFHAQAADRRHASPQTPIHYDGTADCHRLEAAGGASLRVPSSPTGFRIAHQLMRIG